MYPKHIYHHDLEREVAKRVELEDHHGEWYDFEQPDLDDNLLDEEFDHGFEDEGFVYEDF